MKTLKELCKKAVEAGASDLHLVVNKPPILRVNGKIIPIKDEPVLNALAVEKIIFSFLNKEQFAKFKKEKELDIPYQPSEAYRFRVNLHYERNGMGLVARVIPNDIPTMEEIGMPEVAYSLLDQKQGLILVTGPTGCGKSTSLAAMLEYINQHRSVDIITLEDPIEFVFNSKKSIIKQRQLGLDTRTFYAALKHVLRQDPNVIMVGEMRDLETIAATITLAETGHLVLATLHTMNAAQTIDRIIDVFPPHQQEQVRLQLAMFLKGIIAQQLLPTKDGTGRVAAREVMINTPAIGNLIRENKVAQIKTVIQTSAEEGMLTLEQSIKGLIEKGVISQAVADAFLPELFKLD